MPWKNQQDDKGNSGSPWGKDNDKSSGKSLFPVSAGKGSNNAGGADNGGGPRPGGSPGPDIDALLRKGQNQIRQIGGGALVFIIMALAAAFWFFHCFYIVQQNEQAVELRFGRPKQTIAAEGLHFYFWPVETCRKVPLTEQAVTIGNDGSDGLMLSGDQNIVNVNFSVYYYITAPSAYLFNVRDQGGTVQQVAESAMREIVGRRPADDVYRNRREIVANEVRGIIQSTLDKYGLGVQVSRVSIREAAPPYEVADAFNAVQQAEQERNRSIEQGKQERARLHGLANGQAAGIRERAAAYKARIVEEARGEAQRFASVEKQAKTAPVATRFRLYVETLEQMLAVPGKLLIDNAGAGNAVVPYLPLDKLLRSQAPPAAAAEPFAAWPGAAGRADIMREKAANAAGSRRRAGANSAAEVR